MITNPQKALIKRAQAQAAIEDAEYRDALATVSGLPGCHSSTDPRLTDRHVDHILAYFEAIYWRKVDHSEADLPGAFRNPVFQRQGYWAAKNTSDSTSRERYTMDTLASECAQLEARLARLGFGLKYCMAIQNHIRPLNLWKYRAALTRTLESKQHKCDKVAQPF